MHCKSPSPEDKENCGRRNTYNDYDEWIVREITRQITQYPVLTLPGAHLRANIGKFPLAQLPQTPIPHNPRLNRRERGRERHTHRQRVRERQRETERERESDREGQRDRKRKKRSEVGEREIGRKSEIKKY